MTLAVATLQALFVGVILAASCSFIGFLYGHQFTFGAFWRGTILATLGVMLLAEMVGIGSAL